MLTEEQYARNEKVLNAHKSGKTFAEVGRLFGLSKSRVSDVCKQHERRKRVIELKPELRLRASHDRIEFWFEKIQEKC
jgi:hypothetical protein